MLSSTRLIAKSAVEQHQTGLESFTIPVEFMFQLLGGSMASIVIEANSSYTSTGEGSTSPTGKYQCEIPTTGGVMQSIYITLTG